MSESHDEADLHRRAMDVLRIAMDAEPDARQAAIENACANDSALLKEVRSLLDSHERAGGFLEQPALRVAGNGGNAEADNAELLIGKRIGRYVILSLLGRGGMGAVFLAQQDEPRRQVALKILPAAMLAFSRDALRRFRQEAKALARLQHPGIAAIYEAGTHDDGSGATPFFAMEHIPDAQPITTFARTSRLPLQDRLRLFLQACDAVQYGHQRGVIHRDLKPANMLVAARDEETERRRDEVMGEHCATASSLRLFVSPSLFTVKIIDFGIARTLSDDDATDSPHTATMTGAGLAIGTPAYMSPEQSRGDSRDMDVRSDVFALGIVLGELMDGQDAQLAASVPGDVRTIIGKATAQERDRRYQSVADLARDVRRFLDHQPIEARPPSRLYAMRLFVRRNRAMVAAASIAILLLLIAVAGTTFGLVRARAAEREARNESRRFEAVSRFMLDMFNSPNPSQRGEDVKVMDLLREWEGVIDTRFADEPDIQASLHEQIGTAYLELGAQDSAQDHLQRAIDIRTRQIGPRHPVTQTARLGIAKALHRQSKLAESEAILIDIIEILTSVSGADDPDLLQARNDYGLLLKTLGRLDEAESTFRDVMQRRQRLIGLDRDETATTIGNLALLLRERGKLEEAEGLYRQALEIDVRVNGEQNVRTAITMSNLASLLRTMGRLDESEEMAQRTLEIRRKILRPDHPDLLLTMNNMAMLLVSRKKLAEAEPVLRETMEMHQKALGERNIGTMIVSNNYARLLIDLDRPADAMPISQRVIATARDVFGEAHWRVAWFTAGLGSATAEAGDFNEGERLLLSAYEGLKATLGENDPQTRRVAQFVVDAYAAAGRSEDAEAWKPKAAMPPPASQPTSR